MNELDLCPPDERAALVEFDPGDPADEELLAMMTPAELAAYQQALSEFHSATFDRTFDDDGLLLEPNELAHVGEVASYRHRFGSAAFERDIVPVLREGVVAVALRSLPKPFALRVLDQEKRRRELGHCLPRRGVGVRSHRPSRRRRATCNARSPSSSDDPHLPEVSAEALA